jgi:hypothetical protein
MPRLGVWEWSIFVGLLVVLPLTCVVCLKRLFYWLRDEWRK